MPDTMRAVVIARYGGIAQATRRPVPRPGPGEVLVRVRASGLCSTDLHLLSGRQPLGDLPRIVGHELAGDVVELGEGVMHWRQGDRVTAAIDVTCGRCRHCLTGETQRCRAMQRIGFERDGGHADYVAVPGGKSRGAACGNFLRGGGDSAGRRRLHVSQPDPPGWGGNRAAHPDPRGRRARHPRRADREERGAKVLATSRQQQRVALAEQYGAVGINTAHESLEAAVARFTDGEGVDVVVDNIGNRASVRQGLAMLRPGGKFLVVAYLDETFEVPSMPLFKTEQQIIGCRGSTKQDLIDVVRLVRTGQVTPVLGASYALDQIAEAAARLESGDLIGRIWLTRA